MTTLITGARGGIARRLIDLLLADGETVRAASRDPEKTELPDGVEPIRVDFSEPDTITAALDGVDRVFVYSADKGMDNFVTAAVEAKVSKVVLLSSAGAAGDVDPDNFIWKIHREAELAIEGSDLTWMFVRPAMFASNSLWWADSIRSEGVVRVAYPDSMVRPIHNWDIADVAYLGLTTEKFDGQKVVIDGPESLTQRHQVELLAKAIGKELTVEELPRAVAEKFMPTQMLDMLAAGQSEAYGPSAEAATGKPARDFAQWAVDYAESFK